MCKPPVSAGWHTESFLKLPPCSRSVEVYASYTRHYTITISGPHAQRPVSAGSPDLRPYSTHSLPPTRSPLIRHAWEEGTHNNRARQNSRDVAVGSPETPHATSKPAVSMRTHSKRQGADAFRKAGRNRITSITRAGRNLTRTHAFIVTGLTNKRGPAMSCRAPRASLGATPGAKRRPSTVAYDYLGNVSCWREC